MGLSQDTIFSCGQLNSFFRNDFVIYLKNDIENIVERMSITAINDILIVVFKSRKIKKENFVYNTNMFKRFSHFRDFSI